MTPSPIRPESGAKHDVHIEIADGELRYIRPDGQNASSITVRTGDHVTWHCDHGDYSVIFKRHSPFANVTLEGRRGNSSGSAVVVEGNGSYPYSVTIHLASGPLVDDPEVIVDNGGN